MMSVLARRVLGGAWLALLAALATPVVAQPLIAPADRGLLRVLVMAPDYKSEMGLIKDRDSVAARFGAVLEPDSMDELVDQLARIGAGGRIEQLVFIGHGDPKGGRPGFAGDVTATELGLRAAQARRGGDSRLLDAFSQSAEVIFYNCYVGKDPQFLQAAAELFLGFSGGTVYGSENAVESKSGVASKGLFLLDYWIPSLGAAEAANFTSPSTVDYHRFRSYTLQPFDQRALEPAPVGVDGDRQVEALRRARVRALPPERFTNGFFEPWVKYRWYPKGRTAARPIAEGREAMLALDAGSHALQMRAFLDNGIGARLLAEHEWTVTVGDAAAPEAPAEPAAASVGFTACRSISFEATAPVVTEVRASHDAAENSKKVASHRLTFTVGSGDAPLSMQGRAFAGTIRKPQLGSLVEQTYVYEVKGRVAADGRSIEELSISFTTDPAVVEGSAIGGRMECKSTMRWSAVVRHVPLKRASPRSHRFEAKIDKRTAAPAGFQIVELDYASAQDCAGPARDASGEPTGEQATRTVRTGGFDRAQLESLEASVTLVPAAGR